MSQAGAAVINAFIPLIRGGSLIALLLVVLLALEMMYDIESVGRGWRRFSAQRLVQPGVWLFLLALLTLWAYSPTTQAGFVYEDSQWLPLASVPFSAGTPSLYTLLYAPWYLADAIGAGRPWAYHWLIVWMHLVNGGLLYWLVSRRWPANAAVLATGLFWLHPLQVESVAYLSGGRETMGLFWILAAVACAAGVGSRGLRAFGCAVCLGVALGSKSSNIVAVALVPLALWYLGYGQTWRALAPWLALIGAAIALPNIQYVLRLEHTEHILRVGTNGLFAWVAVTCAAIARYLSEIVVPVGFTIDHDWHAVNPLWPTVSVLGLVAWGLLVWQQRRQWPVVAAVTLWLLVALAPRFVVQQEEVLNEHQVLVAFLGVWVGLGIGLDRLLTSSRVREAVVLGAGDDAVFI